jgi:hypothetical protein
MRMNGMSRYDSLCRRAGALAFGFSVVVSAVSFSAPASAQGLLEFLFGRLLNPLIAPQPSTGRVGSAPSSFRATVGPARQSNTRRVRTSTFAYCVRLCDGRYFPVNRAREATPSQLCEALCPAAPTRVFYGGGIDRAAAADGTPYAALDNAFIYRELIVDGCTCNGSSPFGMQRMDVEQDPTLRAGDAVVTAHGSLKFNGRTAGRAAFSPVAGRQGRLTDIRQILASRKFARQ